jgi:hypothetical protein
VRRSERPLIAAYSVLGKNKLYRCVPASMWSWSTRSIPTIFSVKVQKTTCRPTWIE